MGDVNGRTVCVVQVLVQAGAEVNKPDRNGETALDLAQANNFEAVANILKEALETP